MTQTLPLGENTSWEAGVSTNVPCIVTGVVEGVEGACVLRVLRIRWWFMGKVKNEAGEKQLKEARVLYVG